MSELIQIKEVSLLLLYTKLKSMNNDGIVELNLSESESDHVRFFYSQLNYIAIFTGPI